MSLRALLPIEPLYNRVDSIYNDALDERRAILEADGLELNAAVREAAERAEEILNRYIEAHAAPPHPFDLESWREERSDERKERGNSFRAFGMR